MVDPGHTVRVEEAACHGELSLRLKSSMRKKNLMISFGISPTAGGGGLGRLRSSPPSPSPSPQVQRGEAELDLGTWTWTRGT